VGARFFAPVQTDSGAHSASCAMGAGSFPGVKRPGRGTRHPPPLAPRSGMSRVYPYFPSRHLVYCYRVNFYSCVEPGSSVGIATRYRLDGPGIESRWGRGFSHRSRPALRATQPPVQWVPGYTSTPPLGPWWPVKRVNFTTFV
jgi:hypothetical protein